MAGRKNHLIFHSSLPSRIASGFLVKRHLSMKNDTNKKVLKNLNHSHLLALPSSIQQTTQPLRQMKSAHQYLPVTIRDTSVLYIYRTIFHKIPIEVQNKIKEKSTACLVKDGPNEVYFANRP